MQPQPRQPKRGWLDKTQDALNLAGFLPGVGSFADLASAAIYGAKGDWGNAAFSTVAAIPGIGDVGAGLKIMKGGLGKAGRIAGRFM